MLFTSKKPTFFKVGFLLSKKKKKSFSMIEILFVIVLISIVSSLILTTKELPKLNYASQKLTLYLNYTRYIAFLDNKFDIEDPEWEKKRWTLKFQRCTNSEDGFYFVVYSDRSGDTAHFKKEECLKDPLNQKYLYSQSDCVATHDESKNILLTKEYGVKKIEVSCNTTSALGQISFGNDGKIYSQLGTDIKEITQTCLIKIYDKNNNSKTITVEPKTGYIATL